jgi:hypothetical protein
VGPRTDLDDVEKRKFLTLRRLEVRPLGRPARSQYRLSYPGSQKGDKANKKVKRMKELQEHCGMHRQGPQEHKRCVKR